MTASLQFDDGDFINTEYVHQVKPLPTTFACLFCNHEEAVSVKMDKKAGTGELSCKVCGQQFQTGINCKYILKGLIYVIYNRLVRLMFLDLSAGVDVYSDWVDACDVVAQDVDAADGDGMDSYHGLEIRTDHRNSPIQVDRHLVLPMEENDDTQGDFNQN